MILASSFLLKITSMKILFVCIGNTCRSPMAESVMKNWVDQYELDREWEVDSAALRPWNIGRKPEERCIKVLTENGLTSNHYGRMISEEDFMYFDYILGMDNTNVNELRSLAELVGPQCTAKVELFGSYLTRYDNPIIYDPYFSTGMGGFRCTFSQINACCKHFLRAHIKQLKLKKFPY